MTGNLSKPFLVFLIQDNSTMFNLIVNFLEKSNLKFVIAPNPEIAMFHAEYSQPDIILIESEQVSLDSEKLKEGLKSSKFSHSIPILTLTDELEKFSQPGENILTECQAAIQQAQHKKYLYVQSQLLIEQLQNQIQKQNELIQKMQIENQALQRLATLDDLTQLSNRRHFYTYFEEAWQDCQEHTLSLILCDIDYFKLYNDTNGHLAGDLCLKLIATAIREAVSDIRKTRPYLVARYGGEEFAIILPYVKRESASAIAEKIHQKLSRLKIPHPKSPISKFITLSSGISSCKPGQNNTQQMLIIKADQALYKAKEKGRNRIISSDEF